MVTAISEKNVALECLYKRCNDLVTKPIARQLLFDKIKKLGLLN
jgi:CheY-like chemotaxis protein